LSRRSKLTTGPGIKFWVLNISLVAEWKPEMKTRFRGMVQCIRRLRIPEAVTTIVREPQLATGRMPVKSN
jgi:hypothetical protein